ncbi:MAG: translocation/assembly module TamB, partial [Phyllobacteriaceae bacterium]|nr:translocation/assembly module TamB [Phyllobacteriaceae bacterium]
DLTLTLRGANLAYGDVLRTEVGGELRLTGPIAREPMLSGRLDLGRTEITIPERFAANAARLGVKDLAVPPEVASTLALARPKAKRGGGKGAAPWRARLDVTVDAPSRLFVRGRGLDAELGGRLRVSGTTDALVPVGAFDLRRGALDVIGRHIALDKGTVTLSGDLDPTIDFQASSSTRSVAVTAGVTGRASDPTLVLTSTPELPQDEVLAQFLFGRGVSDLTGVQLVQLAAAAAQLAGGPSAPDLLGKIRRSTGLDNLGTTTDSKGNAGLTAGRYIGERIYLGVTAGAGGSTDATVDLDVTRNLKLRGQTGTDGSKAGFVFEKEY